MRSSRKIGWKRQILAWILVLATIFTSCDWPITAYAADAEPAAAEGSSATETNGNTSSEAYILTEDESRRDETTKHFVMSDGTRRAVKYAQSVHYKKDGKWEEIDNTLEYDEENGVYRNRMNSFQVSLDEDADSGRLLTIENEGYTLSWNYEAKDTKRRQIQAKKKKQTASETAYEKYSCNTSDGLSYENMEEFCDIEYIVTGSGVKENIILHSAEGQNRFAFTLTAESMELIKKEDGSIAVCADEDGREIFYIPAPFMYDAKGIYSDAVEYEIQTDMQGKYRLAVVADQSWLLAKERAYPVTIDPIITTKKDRTDIDSTFIASDSSYSGTNFAEYKMLSIGWETSAYGKTRTLVKFELPELNKGDMVVSATLGLALYQKSFYTSSMADQQINAHVISEDWAYDSVTWKNQPSYNSVVYDYDFIRQNDTDNAANWKYFDITKAVKGWYEGTIENHGILIKKGTESGTAAESAACGRFWSEKYNEVTDAYPQIIITYRNNKGIESYWSYTTFGAGAAGTAYVNDYSGNLVFEAPLTSSISERMPINLSMIYNEYCANVKYTSGKNSSYKTTPGRGWKLNIQQTVLPSSQYGLSGEEAEEYPFVYTDGDGTEHYFKKKSYDSASGKYICEDEDGLGLTLTNKPDRTATYQISDKNGNHMYFNNKGNLGAWYDANGNRAIITFRDHDGDGVGDRDKIQKITDGVGHTYTFSYYVGSNGIEQDYIDTITDNAGREIQWTYDGAGKVVKIAYSDATQSTFTYLTSDQSLASVTDHDGYGLHFSYTPASDGRKISMVQEKGGSTYGQKITFDRTKYHTTMIRSAGMDGIHHADDTAYGKDDIITTYQFDNQGRTTSVQSKYGSGEDAGAGAYTYTSGMDDETTFGKKNKISHVASLGKNTVNLVKGGNAESLEKWASATSGVVTTQVDTTVEHRYMGSKSFAIHNSEIGTTGNSYLRQIYRDFTIGDTYTLSAYVKTEGLIEAASDTRSGAHLQLSAYNADGSLLLQTYSQVLKEATDVSINHGFRRLTTTITVPENTATLRIYLCLRNATGRAYFDCIQLENGEVANDYNMLENASFEDTSNGMPLNWSASGVTYSENANGTVLNGVSANGKKEGSKGLRIKGDATLAKGFSQNVEVEGNPEDTYIVSGWAAAYAVNPTYHSDVRFELSVRVYYTLSDGSKVYQDKEPARFNPNISSWQYASVPVVLAYEDGESGETYEPVSITVLLRYNRQANYAYFDHIQLIKDVAPSYVYDDDGNVVSVSANAKQKSDMEYEGSDLKKYTDAAGYTSEYSYDDKHNLLTAVSPKGLETKFVYNGYGLLTSSEIHAEKAGAETESIIKTETSYTSADAESGIKEGAYIQSTSDAHGNKTEYFYDWNTGKVTSIADVNGNAASYAYAGNYEKLSAVTSAGSKVQYNYVGNRLSSILVSGTGADTSSETYHFTYDDFGNVSETKTGTTTLVTYTYGTNNGFLLTSVYGNGDGLNYHYDNAGNVTEMYRKQDTSDTFEQEASFQWKYSSDGTPLIHQDSLNNLKYVYSYDSIGRLIRQELSDDTGGTYKGFTEFGYDARNYLTKITNQAGNRTVIQKCSYAAVEGLAGSEEDAKDGLLTRYQISEDQYADYSYDALNRLTETHFYLGGTQPDAELIHTYEYHASERGGVYATTQLKTETVDGVPYDYAYDKAGNITSIKKNNTAYKSYTYDIRNQLIRENDKETDTTSVWNYDALGNIQSRTEYGYTEDSALQNERKTVNYSYGTDSDAGWNNLLTAIETAVYNSDGTTETERETIDYDAIGNPVCYRGAVMEWFGRQLSSYEKNGLTITYTYDADGFRGSKTVNGIKSTYQYVGGQLFYENRGNGQELYYLYDGYGNLAAIRVHEGELSDTYYVLTNAQGDVIGLYTEDGNQVAAYEYDAWGNQTVYRVAQVNGEDVYTEIPQASDTDSIAVMNPIRYRGYYYDAETGLYYLNSRYYDPEVGRFISADAVEVITASPMALTDKNLFAYCDNNPVMRTDGNGEFWVTSFFVGVAKQYIGDVIGNVVSGKTGLDIFVPSSSLGQYVASGVTEMIPGSGFRKIVVDNVVTEYFVSSEKYLTGEENNIIEATTRIGTGILRDGVVSGTKKSVDVELESKVPKNYSSYARKYYNTMPQTARKVIENNMARELKRNSRIRTGVSFGIDVIAKSIR